MATIQFRPSVTLCVTKSVSYQSVSTTTLDRHMQAETTSTMNHFKYKLNRLLCSTFRPPLSLCPWQCGGLITPNQQQKKKTCVVHGLTQCTSRPTHSGFGIRRKKTDTGTLDGDRNIFRHCNEPTQKRGVGMASKINPPLMYLFIYFT